MKTCYKCGQQKPLDAFSVDRSRPDGRHSRCRDCRRSHYQENREEAAEASRKYYVENKQHHDELSRAYYHQHRAERAAKMAEWYAKNREAVAKAGKAWREDNHPRKAASRAKQRAIQLSTTPAWADLEMIRSVYEDAARLTEETGIRHEVDHIVPLNSEVVSGLHVEFNLQVITRSQNRSKANKFPL